ncbi:MAG: hypothetical protein ACPG4U_04930 [Pseudomonadales bacterium]
MLSVLAVAWAWLGVSVFLISAIVKMSEVAWQLELAQLSVLQWLILGAWVSFMGFFEGYKGFQKGFSPRVAARLLYLKDNVSTLRLLLAPFFCLGYFQAPLRRKVFICCMTVLIVLIVALVKEVSAPWRQIIDAGVVVGLSWGLLAFWYFSYMSLSHNRFFVDPETSPQR